MIFKTQRLKLRLLNQADADLFYELMGNPNVMHPIPQKTFTRTESDEKLMELISKSEHTNFGIWAVTEMQNDNLIGIAGFLVNNENDNEIAYRFIERYWGKGYGTEIAKGLIDYSFSVLELNKITADVFVNNTKSAKILEKLMQPVREFYNETDKCTDRRYELLKKDWLKI